MAKKSASGAGNIRKKTVMRNGKEYTYWEARITVGVDAGTGKQKTRSFSGKTQAEVRKKMQAAAVEVDNGTYQEPNKITLGEWLDIWIADYLKGVKPRTVDSYKASVKNHIKPALGAVKLQALNAPMIQNFCNQLEKTEHKGKPLSAKTIHNTHGVLHKALEQAVEIGYIRFNPANACKLPRKEKKEIKPLDNDAISLFINAINGHKFEMVYLVTLFTGMREGEVLGLTWDCIDFQNNEITIKQQLQKERGGNGEYHLVSPKNGKTRRISVAPTVISALKKQRAYQSECMFASHGMWHNPMNLVFTNELGHNLSAQTVYLHFKEFAKEIGMPDARFHDLRHSYAVAALSSGDDIKTVQESLGHYTAAFTLDVYGHVTEKMKEEHAARMEKFIKEVSNGIA